MYVLWAALHNLLCEILNGFEAQMMLHVWLLIFSHYLSESKFSKLEFSCYAVFVEIENVQEGKVFFWRINKCLIKGITVEMLEDFLSAVSKIHKDLFSDKRVYEGF